MTIHRVTCAETGRQVLAFNYELAEIEARRTVTRWANSGVRLTPDDREHPRVWSFQGKPIVSIDTVYPQ